MAQLSIAGRTIGPEAPPYVIAEIGANHNGDMALCRRLIDAAQANGADAVKFQSWTKQSLISRGEYARNTRYAPQDGGPTLEQAVERYQLTPERHREIAAYCRDRGIVFFSSCFSRAEVDLLEQLEVPAYKIASMDVNHLPLLEYVGATGKPVLLSTGMATMGEVERALEVLRSAGAGPIALLHCVSIYPCGPELVNLRMLPTWRQAFGVPVGYSDHTIGTAVPCAAVALGAVILEKHFTLDRALAGWDHAISADPAELRALVDGALAAWAALGSAVRTVGAEELQKRQAFRRRLVAGRALRCGERVTADDLEFKRPGTGIRPDEAAYVVGRVLARDLAVDEEIEWSDFQ
ncbi:MAG TPA: N-acetylneuraminate synthase family protein [Gemmatimonadales bacterium]|nr:N-acetylneuraminate synthase family protein [Gemmatimonadales bacterium]